MVGKCGHRLHCQFCQLPALSHGYDKRSERSPSPRLDAPRLPLHGVMRHRRIPGAPESVHLCGRAE